ncbi:MAG TPA: TonB-dependent receptor [Bryobacteraceae bacterium]|nr:TonB-dependent receptor [Bryobacteraceae bacterium]
MTLRRFLLPAFLLLPAGAAFGQIITGSISGSVQDPSGLAVAAAGITLTQPATGLVRHAASDVAGAFVFPGLEAGEYNLSISKPGFKRSEAKDLHLVSGQRLAAGSFTLDVGATSETITVRAESAAVQTQSAERASVVTSAQIDGLLIQGRNPTSLVGLLPGVVVTQETQALDRDTIFSVMGNRRTANNVAIDGVPTVDLDNGFSQKLQVNMDAVGEVQVLLSNYQAEYGRNAGSNVNILTKSGTRDFHGMASYFKRHEQFNATNFFDNQLGQKKPRYRYNTWSYNVGGPIALGKFNRDRNKLFFFWSQEFWPIRTGGNRTVTMPTDLERAGDFSQSRDVNNALITVRDPLTGQPFAGNRIPAARLDPSGVALLKAFDNPNFFDRNISRGNYNYVFTAEINAPKRSDLLKGDWNINPKNQVYVSYTGFNEVSEGAVGSTGAQANWPQMKFKFQAPNRGVSGRYTRIFSPSMVNELQVGWLRNPESHTISDDQLKRNQRDAVGFLAGQFNPPLNPLKLVPNATFGGVPSAANFAINGRFPADNRYDVLSFTDKLTLIRGPHTLKAGGFFEWDRRDVNQGVAFNGSIDFGRNANNPLDTGYAYSNAALGVFNSYSEPSARPRLYGRSRTLELFAQDNWRINSRLTLDYGMRFYWVPPIFDAKDGLAGFGAGLFDPARAVKLISPALNAQNQRIGIDPVTRTPYPATLIGAVAPNSGDTANGLVVSGQKGYPRSLMEDRGIQFGPRFGFAYDPFGKGRTSIRGGIGVFYNRLTANVWLPLVAQPPLVQTPLINYGRLSTLLSSSGLLFPSNVLGLDREGKVPMVTNYSLTVQHNVGWGVVVDAAYVASLGRHLYWNRDLNPIPAGANFDSRNFDPTLPGRPLPPAFLRPLIGDNSINVTEPASSSSYHSLQMTANRRFARGLQLGVAWTWSKAMDFNSSDTEAVSTLVPARIWNYGLSAFDRTHVVKINWLYDLPSTPWKKGPAHWTLDGWEVSGIASFVSGAPLGMGFTTVSAVDTTGTPSQGARVNLTGNPVLPKGDRTFYQNFRTDVFAAPAVGTFGNAARSVIRGPGTNNFDIAIFKNFPVHEKIRFQFRAEMYNAFNHTQFTGLDTTTRFDNAGRQVNTRLGQFTSARDPRQIQLALRFYF